MKFGCLQVIDDGSEFLQLIDERILKIQEEKQEFIAAAEAGKLELIPYLDNTTPAYKYTPKNFKLKGSEVKGFLCGAKVSSFDEAISELIKDKERKHFKCICKKCGKKNRYYSEETLRTEPKECYKPMYCSPRLTDSAYEKREKYENNESVLLLDDKNMIVPSDKYCGAWNKQKEKQLRKKEKEKAKQLAALPRKKAKNYEVDYVGSTYESLDVLECVNDSLEGSPNIYSTQHRKVYKDITVYKEYRCKCYLCGKEQLIRCDEFGIYPPTDYGLKAYNGYWSKVHCDCHPLSSFQWIVNDILIKHNVKYKVEVQAEGLYGTDNSTPLRFDFGVYKNGVICAYIECQGEQHFKPVEEFGGEKQFAIQKRNDEEKRKYAKNNNIILIEISYKKKKYEVVESILKAHGII